MFTSPDDIRKNAKSKDHLKSLERTLDLWKEWELPEFLNKQTF